MPITPSFCAKFSNCIAGLLGASTLALWLTGPAEAQAGRFTTFSASGTHTCQNAERPSCVVTGLGYSNCIDAENSLKVRDCCRIDQVCSRDERTQQRTCKGGGTSVGFVLNYCIRD